MKVAYATMQNGTRVPIEQVWTGTHVTASGAAIVVKYKAPTDHRCSRWIATCYRNSECTYRATATFQDGPIAAAEKLLVDAGLNWTIQTVATINPDTYVITTR